jgi:hypothetical protein
VIVVLLIACAYTSATSAPLLVSVALCSSTVAVVWRDSLDRPIAIRNAVGAIGALLLMALLYRTHGPHPAVNVEPQFDFSAILQAFSVAALQPSEPSRLAYLVFGFAIAGAATCAYRNRRHAVILTGMAVFPAALAWLALAWFHHWFEIRYLSAALPAYLILAGIGITEAGRALARLTSNVRTARAVEIAVAFAIAVPIAAKALPAARTEPYRKLNWRLIASTVWQHAAPGDIVVAASDWSAISLGFYLEQLPPRVRMINAREHTSTVEALVRENQPVWIVSAGYYRTNVLPGWFCRYHPLLASPLESFGLHYSPGRSHFLRSRALPGEWRAVSAPFRHGFSLSFSGDDDTFLGDGWAGRERIGGDDVRWVMGSAASVILPLDTTEAHRVRIRMMPFEARGLPPQRLRVYADAALIVEQTMSPGWRDYEVPWPARASRLLRLELSRANAPAEHDRSSSDRRQLSALVTEITVDASAAIPVGPFAFSVRLQELDRDGTAQVLDDVTATHETQFSPRTWRRDALVALAGRSGFDPDFAVPRLIAGTMTIEDLAESLLDRSGCLDDVAFVRNAYWSIIGRSVTEDDARRIVKPWTTAKARRRLIQGLIESSEFRQRMTERTRDAE